MKSRLTSVLSQLRRVVVRQSEGGLSDGQLLERFVHQRDEAAFEVLVWRHGPMVLGVARRLLRNLADAEDVLQATFLALVRQAKSIRRRQAIAGWLYTVAYRLALRLRQQRNKHAAESFPVEEVAAPCDEAQESLCWLDEELQLLPEKYRIPLVLSYLQGMTNQEIAAQMICPLGTVFTRLARGRELLRKRLLKRGVMLPSVLASIVLASGQARATLRVDFVRATIQAALTFSQGSVAAGTLAPNVLSLLEGVEKMMAVNRWKLAGVIMGILAILGSGAGLLAWRGAAPEQPSNQTPAKAAAQDEPENNRERPKIVQVFPADGATEVEPNTEIRIRFDRPMDRNSVLLEGNPFGRKEWNRFRPRGELRYIEATHEFILPVQLIPGHIIELAVNANFGPLAKGEDYKGFQSREHIATKPYYWSFTTKKPAVKEGKRPRVTAVTPASDTEVSLLTLLEVTFDQPMDPNYFDLSSADTSDAQVDRSPRLLRSAEYDPQKQRFALLLGMPANWNGEMRLEGFRNKDGIEAEPVVVKYRTLRTIHSPALQQRIEQAGKTEKLRELVDRVRKARTNLRSVREDVRMTMRFGQHPSWYSTFWVLGSTRFQMQGEHKYLAVIDSLMGGKPFRVGSDGTTCWFRHQDDLIELPVKEIKEKNLLFCDPFNASSTATTERVIGDMKLEYLGEAVVSGRRCHRVRSWVAELTSLNFPVSIHEWYIDAETLLPSRVVTPNLSETTLDFLYSRVNEALPEEEFRPERDAGIKKHEGKPLEKGYTDRYLNVRDGSNGRMSVRWGEKGPGRQSSSGLN